MDNVKKKDAYGSLIFNTKEIRNISEKHILQIVSSIWSLLLMIFLIISLTVIFRNQDNINRYLT